MIKVPYFKHNIGKQEMASLQAVLDNGIITLGPETKKFEDEIAGYTHNRYALGVSSGTDALFLLYEYIQRKTNKKYVLLPSMTFLSTVSSAMHNQLIPFFIDCDNSGLMDLQHLKHVLTEVLRPEDVAVVCPVHMYGRMVDMLRLGAMADEFGFFVIEDSAHCVEGISRGNSGAVVRPGNMSLGAILSFQAMKNISSGEGGCILTNDEEVYSSILMRRRYGVTQTTVSHKVLIEKYDAPMLGWKMNLSDIQSAFLRPQLDRIDESLDKRKKLCRAYDAELADCGLKSVIVSKNDSMVRDAHHLYPVCLPERDKVMVELSKQGIPTAIRYQAVHTLSRYRNVAYDKLVNTNWVSDNFLTLPLYPKMPIGDVSVVVQTLKECLLDLGVVKC